MTVKELRIALASYPDDTDVLMVDNAPVYLVAGAPGELFVTDEDPDEDFYEDEDEEDIDV